MPQHTYVESNRQPTLGAWNGAWHRTMPALQVAVFVMIGGGFTGNSAARQPEDFSIDDRAGRLHYSRRDIMKAVAQLTETAKQAGLDPRDLPRLPSLHNCGVW